MYENDAYQNKLVQLAERQIKETDEMVLGSRYEKIFSDGLIRRLQISDDLKRSLDNYNQRSSAGITSYDATGGNSRTDMLNIIERGYKNADYNNLDQMRMALERKENARTWKIMSFLKK